MRSRSRRRRTGRDRPDGFPPTTEVVEAVVKGRSIEILAPSRVIPEVEERLRELGLELKVRFSSPCG